MNIIAISGKRRSGKTSLANILKQEYGYYPIALAETLKNDVSRKYGLNYEQTDGCLKESPTQYIDRNANHYLRYWTPREIMILEGQHTRRIDPDYYCKKLFDQMKLAEQPHPQIFVVTDVRFLNELDWMKKHKALLVRLERNEELTGTYINDPSETELDNYKEWDVFVPASQNINIDDLHRTAELIQTHLLARSV